MSEVLHGSAPREVAGIRCVPLFVSHRRLGNYRTLPVASHSWALDSGGFSELDMYGTWKTTPQSYVRSVRRYIDEVGRWMGRTPGLDV